ncbi:MAG: hypothetical protein EZS28_011166 [Streblomastix strix]|uniref:Protein kinase domain-containing protein n=1 Tax=Streblomastix strix TaxID=222440 RepID=A0A5J4WEY0_9EUKA|nr:MAG: hypothetical protein EZS28_011166 [Streblomastix strix]
MSVSPSQDLPYFPILLEIKIKQNVILIDRYQFKERRIERHANITDDLIWDLLMKLLDFDPKTRISALEAFQHQFFTSPQIIAQIPLESKCIEEKALQMDEDWITKYDMNPSSIPKINELSD